MILSFNSQVARADGYLLGHSHLVPMAFGWDQTLSPPDFSWPLRSLGNCKTPRRDALAGQGRDDEERSRKRAVGMPRVKAGALNGGSLLRASLFPQVVHELLESGAHLSGGERLGLKTGIINALRYRRSPL